MFQMRIVKLAQSWNTMKTLLGIIFQTMGALVNLVIILALIIFIFAVLGNQLLGVSYGKYEDIIANPELADYGGELPRYQTLLYVKYFLESISKPSMLLCL